MYPAHCELAGVWPVHREKQSSWVNWEGGISSFSPACEHLVIDFMQIIQIWIKIGRLGGSKPKPSSLWLTALTALLIFNVPIECRFQWPGPLSPFDALCGNLL